MLYPLAQFPLYVSGCLLSKMSHCYFNSDLKACYSLGFIYIASYYSTQVCPVPRCADISHYLRVWFQRASRSQWSSSPVRMGCSPTSITPAVLGNTSSPSPGEVSTSQRGELYAACFTALPQHITSSNLNDWVSWGLRRSHVQDLVFFLSPLCEADCFSFFNSPLSLCEY